jgi:hypothetical protein
MNAPLQAVSARLRKELVFRPWLSELRRCAIAEIQLDRVAGPVLAHKLADVAR